MDERGLDFNLNQVFSLIVAGRPLGRPTSVSGGLLHRMWRVETEEGTFAVKVLNHEIMTRSDAKQNFRNSEKVARIALNSGICAVTARTVGNDPWIESNGVYVMVFDWIDGHTLRSEECTPDHIAKIGSVLFQLHSLNIAIDGVEPTIWSGVPEDTWIAHMNKAHELTACWAFDGETLLSEVVNWSRMYQNATQRLSHWMIMSHGDLDSKNVLWNNSMIPYVIDWESAGYVNPTVELIEAAINWGRNEDGMPDKTRFQSLIQSYVQAGGSLRCEIADALNGSMGGMLGWLEYNMRRSIEEDIFNSDERNLAQNQVKQTIHQLRKFADSIPEYAQWCEEILI